MVDFDALVRAFIVGGSVVCEAGFEWRATGAPQLQVDIQARSNSGTFPRWTTVLSRQPPVDVATSPVAGQPGEQFCFRAVARDPNGNESYSNTICPPVVTCT